MTEKHASMPSPATALIDAARAAATQGRIAEAEAVYRRVLDIDAGSVEALNFLAMCRLAQQQPAQAVELLERARAVAPLDAETHKSLGLAYRAGGDAQRGAQALTEAVRLDPDYYVARLHLGVALEQLGLGDEALVQYFRAVRQAQAQGRWLSEATTPPGLRPTVLAAMRTVDYGRRRLFENSFAPLRTRYGANALARVERALAIYLGETPPNYPDPRQRPLFLFFPDLASRPYYDRALFPWLAALEAQTGAIRTELLNMLAADHGFEPFLRFDSAARVEDYLRGTNGQQAWQGFFFYRHGERRDDNAARCPHTAAVLDTLPIVRIREHAPEVLFSVLTPGAHILPHRGVTNTRLVTHLPLVVPPDCALRVGGIDHVWEEGRCVVFDDTYEHEAWNRSDLTRVVLILDTWHPDLTDAERAAVTDLVEAIGAFNSAAGVK
jgi:aspartate beta-hydroxylase